MFVYTPATVYLHISLLCFEYFQPVISYFSSQFSCLATVPTLLSRVDTDEVDVNTPQTGLVHKTPEFLDPDPGPSHLPTHKHRSEPILILNLFATESFKQQRIGPCAITADQRVYVEVCVIYFLSSSTSNQHQILQALFFLFICLNALHFFALF